MQEILEDEDNEELVVEENKQKQEAGRTDHRAKNNRYMARSQMLTRSPPLAQIQSAIKPARLPPRETLVNPTLMVLTFFVHLCRHLKSTSFYSQPLATNHLASLSVVFSCLYLAPSTISSYPQVCFITINATNTVENDN